MLKKERTASVDSATSPTVVFRKPLGTTYPARYCPYTKNFHGDYGIYQA
jgi:hypothetical protein